MQPKLSHPWNLSKNAAIRLQTEWAEKIRLEGISDTIEMVAGIEIESPTSDLCGVPSHSFKFLHHKMLRKKLN